MENPSPAPIFFGTVCFWMLKIINRASLEETERILVNFPELWSSYETLTEEQRKFLEKSRLDQDSFFGRHLDRLPHTSTALRD
jgi:hypothetical protein